MDIKTCVQDKTEIQNLIRRAVSDGRNKTKNGRVIIKRVAKEVKRDPRVVKKYMAELS